MFNILRYKVFHLFVGKINHISLANVNTIHIYLHLSNNSFTKMDKNLIIDKLPHGAGKKIAQIGGYSTNYVSLVLNGKRNCNRIWVIASQLINADEQTTNTLTEKYNRDPQA